MLHGSDALSYCWKGTQLRFFFSLLSCQESVWNALHTFGTIVGKNFFMQVSSLFPVISWVCVSAFLKLSEAWDQIWNFSLSEYLRKRGSLGAGGLS